MNITNGEYKTRDGTHVTVTSVGNSGSFSIKGYIHEMFRGKIRPRYLRIWKPDGSFMAVGQHKFDLIERI